MNQTHIEWADRTWNPITGCSPISPACDHCYAARMANRLLKSLLILNGTLYREFPKGVKP